MNWEEELRNKLTKLQLDYYDKGVKGHTVCPNDDSDPIIKHIKSLLKKQRENCAEAYLEQSDLDNGFISSTADRHEIIADRNRILNAPEPKGE